VSGQVIKIGDFSKICQVSIKALRHWDKVDLLSPAVIDDKSGYRYYAIEQVETVNRIIALRVTGLTLTQIKQLLHDNPAAEDIRAMFHQKREQVLQEIENAEFMLNAIESRLQVIEHRGEMPDYEVTVKPVAAMSIMAAREVVPTMNNLVELLYEIHPYALNSSGTNLLAVFHDEGYDLQSIDVEVGFPVNADVQRVIQSGKNRELTVRQLPGVPMMACTVHHGSWDSLPVAYNHIGHWILRNGYQITGIGREVFHHIDWEKRGGKGQSTVTEIQFPIGQ